MIRTLSLLLFLIAAPVLAAHPTTITDKVVSLADGDALTVLDAAKTQHKVRRGSHAGSSDVVARIGSGGRLRDPRRIPPWNLPN